MKIKKAFVLISLYEIYENKKKEENK